MLTPRNTEFHKPCSVLLLHLNANDTNRHTYQQLNTQAQRRVTLQEKYIWKEENSRKANAGGAGSSYLSST